MTNMHDDDEDAAASGWDSLDCLRDWPPEMNTYVWAYDTLDVIESRQREMMTRCTTCADGWLAGPEALESGSCWRCRTA